MNNDLKVSAERAESAKCPEDVFGNLTGTKDEQKQQLVGIYRKLVIVLHPDRYSAQEDIDLANEAFRLVTAARVEAEKKITDGTYGDRKVAAAAPSVALDPIIIDTRNHQYKVEMLITAGEIADLYLCTEQKSSETVMLKVARNARDNDLMQNESTIIRKLYPADKKDVDYYRYFVKLRDTFMLRGSKGSQRRVNVFPVVEGYVTLQQVMDAWQDGLDYRDMAWMLKRMFAALGFLHREGILHGAINPSHVMVHPTKHGAKIIDWCYGVSDLIGKKARVRVMSEQYSDYCAPEIKNKQRPSPATDIYSAVACAVALVGGNPATGVLPETVPVPVRRFLNGCMIVNPARRPEDAWDLHEEFDTVLRKLVGRPRYRPLSMPEITMS